MTNEEIIQGLYRGDSKAIDMAIKALEQQTSEDCISRYELREAISALTYWHFNDDGKLEIGGAFDNTVYKVDDVERLERVLPSVTLSRPRGKWIYEMQIMNNPYTHKCSVCKEWQQYKFNYCPNCGADMRESEKA